MTFSGCTNMREIQKSEANIIINILSLHHFPYWKVLMHCQGGWYCVWHWDGVPWGQKPSSLMLGLVTLVQDSKQYPTVEKEQIKPLTTTKVTFIASWNVRSCCRITKRLLIIGQLKRYQIQVAALAETMIPESGVCVVNGYTYIHIF